MAADPYKSRLFNLINRRLIRLKDNLGRVSRRGQNAIAIALQIALYPVYLLVQSLRMTANQLGNSLQKQLSPPGKDGTDAIEEFLQSLSDQETPFIGIAADLEDQALVFVTNDHQTVKITDNQTQRQIEKQIRTALANYALAKRRIKRLNRQYPPLLPNFTDKNPVLPPIRWFWNLLRWEQQGQIAIAINLFQETHLVKTPTPPSLPLPNLNSQAILEVIDEKLAIFEAKFLAISPAIPSSFSHTPNPPSEIVNESPTIEKNSSYLWGLYWLIYAAIEHFWAKEKNYLEYSADSPALSAKYPLSFPNSLLISFKQRLQDWLEKQTQADPFTIGKLIQAAINHFFSSRQSLTFSAVSEQPWLESADILAISPQDSEKPRLNPAYPLPQSHSTKKAFSQEKQNKSLPKIPPAAAEITPGESPPATQLDPRYAREIIQPINEEWLETESTPVGYVKHPLERILEGLDAIILWVEELVIKIWRWLRYNRRISKLLKRKR
ncbi:MULTISPECIES: hypothetical protein [unclassified Microcystis]|uniref:hypothetical protein n=1 Tax=unclassified Microcystis TaxID=2643300 RepID=UPI00118FEA0B|nr:MULTISPECIES: hypothetical protein [unclassified Microcystis]MCA2924749.1 hypothetical protein [Microcystis sp. M020S1]MCA2934613.1 hypothetical protein [Microcystis sp. M015S1]MCA2619538.1 hypothetical protein [Microcystis sp. M099S2]MCA2651874.1 hypothetical protein [Microcystis sp. M065S2]MCA2680585.1 hypothetical protein [Microcystis sp. M043S2]